SPSSGLRGVPLVWGRRVICSKRRQRRSTPTRQGVHWPQDSSRQKVRKKWATSTIQLASSITTRPPEPMITPAFTRDWESTGVSRIASGNQPPEGPPIDRKSTRLNSSHVNISYAV